MRNWGRLTAGVFFAVFLLNAFSVLAESQGARSFKSCDSYRSSDQFVREATSYCLKSGDSSICDRRAQRYFDYCGFSGDYREISQKVYKKLLVMFMLTQARDVSSIGQR